MIKYLCECVICQELFFDKNEKEILCYNHQLLNDFNQLQDNFKDLGIDKIKINNKVV